MTAILGNVHDDAVMSTVTIPSAGTGSPTPDLAAPSTGGSLQMVTARLRQPREYPPLWAALEHEGLFSVAAHERRFCARRLILYGAPANMARLLSRWCSARAGLPIRRHGDFSGIGHFDLPALPCLAMRGLPCRTGALDRLALITQVPRSLQHRRHSTRQLRRTRQRPAANR